MSVEIKLLENLLMALSALEHEAVAEDVTYDDDSDCTLEEAWSHGVFHSVELIMEKLGITKDALTGEYKLDI